MIIMCSVQGKVLYALNRLTKKSTQLSRTCIPEKQMWKIINTWESDGAI